MSGQPFLSSFRTESAQRKAWTTSLPYWSATIAWIKSNFLMLVARYWKKGWQRCRSHSRNWCIWCSCRIMRCQSFPFRFWADLPLVCNSSGWIAFQFQVYRSYFHLPLTLSPFALKIFLIPGTFHPMRWSWPSPR
ncbi:hypothetical protein DFH94DRAFT_767200 [Russula ochroleuca]|uniref:Uncharacterized protein n=1 Tax=Russula ochroleuca TaxID=152965 RepID=A0A9P5JZ95_9AGAM|nr:hypothetical protein DFH94DRAFT_767200 [Russula ochroleuca]